MEAYKQESKSLRKRRRPGGDTNTSESVLSDDTGSKHYSIRSRRTPKSTPDDASGTQSSNEKEAPSPVATSTEAEQSRTTTVATPQTASPLQHAARELHARIMSRVRDLTPNFIPTTSNKPLPALPSTAPTPKINSDLPSNPPQSTPSPANNNETTNKDTTRTVKELQHLISQYVQRQRATLGIPNAGPTSPISGNPTNASSNPTIRSNSNSSNVPNTSRAPTDINNSTEINSDNTFQKSSIIANKFSNAINKYARTSNAPNSTVVSSTTNNHLAGQQGHHPVTPAPQYSSNGAKPSNQAGIGHEGGPSIPRSVASFSRPVSSILDKNVPSLSIQYKHNQKEKRRKTEYGYYDETSSNSSDGNTNYFLLAAQHELQNMDEEMAAMEKLEMMEDEVERLQRGITMRDRVIKRLHDEIEEKDAIIQALPYELVSNWAAASHMMMGQ